MHAALDQAPNTISIVASSPYFQSYTSGILTDAHLCDVYVDHAVLAVGYGIEGEQDYYIVKNSWGSSWGEDGYVRIGTDGNGAQICQVQSEPVYAIA